MLPDSYIDLNLYWFIFAGNQDPHRKSQENDLKRPLVQEKMDEKDIERPVLPCTSWLLSKVSFSMNLLDLGCPVNFKTHPYYDLQIVMIQLSSRWPYSIWKWSEQRLATDCRGPVAIAIVALIVICWPRARWVKPSRKRKSNIINQNTS